jgi:hypothetical protein
MTRVEIDVDDPETLGLWEAVGELVERLPGDWVLIGGLMVQLYALQHGDREVRVTVDIDVLGQARPARSSSGAPGLVWDAASPESEVPTWRSATAASPPHTGSGD